MCFVRWDTDRFWIASPFDRIHSALLADYVYDYARHCALLHVLRAAWQIMSLKSVYSVQPGLDVQLLRYHQHFYL